MANTLLTLGGITREALRLFKNSNAFLQTIDRQYDSSFAKTGAKIGSTLKIRLPNDFTVRTGANMSTQDTTEKSVTLTVGTQKGVDVAFLSSDLALSLDDFSTRILAPMVNKLAGAVANDVMTLADGVPNLVHNIDASNNTISPTAATWLQAGAVLDLYSAPRGNRCAVVDALTQARTVAALTGLFNPTNSIGDQYKAGQMGGTGGALGINDWRMDQTVLVHTAGAYSTLGTVSGSNQTGASVTTSSLAGPIAAGDVVSFAGSFQTNRVTDNTTGQLAQFVVTSAVNTSATSIPIYPSISTTAPYKTVSASPTNGGAITVATKASEQYRKNLVFLPQAFTLVTADLELPTGAVVDAARQVYDGISLRMIRDYLTSTDQFATRLDILYGYVAPRPEWAVIVADAL
jgi:hypothetical protein